MTGLEKDDKKKLWAKKLNSLTLIPYLDSGNNKTFLMELMTIKICNKNLSSLVRQNLRDVIYHLLYIIFNAFQLNVLHGFHFLASQYSEPINIPKIFCFSSLSFLRYSLNLFWNSKYVLNSVRIINIMFNWTLHVF